MRIVAPQASFRLDRWMLVHPRTTFIRVTLRADHVLIDRGPQVVVLEGAMNVMAVSALDHALIHRVMEGHVELRPDIGVALIAKRRLRLLQQVLLDLGVMDVVTTDATQARLGVWRALEVRMDPRMTAQARCNHFMRRGLGGIEDLGNVPASGDMQATRPVAVFTGHALVSMQVHHLGMRIVGEVLHHIRMAHDAGFLAHKFGPWDLRGGWKRRR